MGILPSKQRTWDLSAHLHANGVSELYIAGLATDYCVKASALDAAHKGFKTFVVTDAIAAVNVKPEGGQKALEEMQLSGITLIDSSHLI